jgi:uncharacterized membrane protein YsdA (DUF1294 family)/cold shock CspA family protein
MRFEGTLTSWNDERGFGRIEASQGGEPIFLHVSAWPRGNGRPAVGQSVSFEVELGPKGKRARNVQLVRSRHAPVRKQREGPAQWGTATLFAIPAFLVLYVLLAFAWKFPLWVAGAYSLASVAAFISYAMDKSAATSGGWRTPESTLHMLALVGGWPGALVAQQALRHKSSKAEFRQVFWGTVLLNVAGLVVLASPFGRKLLSAV